MKPQTVYRSLSLYSNVLLRRLYSACSMSLCFIFVLNSTAEAGIVSVTFFSPRSS